MPISSGRRIIDKKEKERLLVMGASGYGKWVLRMLREDKATLIAFVDSNTKEALIKWFSGNA